MKILVRILIVLLAAIVVVGATYGVTQIPAVQTAISSQGGEHGPPAGTGEEAATADGTLMFSDTESESAEEIAATTTSDTDTTSDTQTTATASTTQARPQRGEGGQSGGNLAGLVEVGKNLGIVLAASLAIAAAGFVAKRLRPQRRARAAAV